MGDINRYEFDYTEVAIALIKQQNLHEGIWAVSLKFGIGGVMGGPTEAEAVPTAMVPVLSIGLVKVDKEGRNAVDAAKVNPVKSTKVTTKARSLMETAGRK